MTDTTIETRLPGGKWVREVTAVDAKAKTGYDWTGEFMPVGAVVDLDPGALVANAAEGGSRKSPTVTVKLRALLPNGKWHMIAESGGKEWAMELRKIAREWLALSESERAARALGEALTTEHARLAGRRERLAAARAIAETLPTKIAEWAEGRSPGQTQHLSIDMPLAKSTSTQSIGDWFDPADLEAIAAKLTQQVAYRVSTIEEAVAEAEVTLAALQACITPAAPAELTAEEQALVAALQALSPERRALVLADVAR